ncbi:MAG: acetyl-CoA carboxylase biotin carboxyl carrier protein subunit [Bacteroidales bacterium]|nr:acetyl-CoA carboxylase biotin carboxyl carrier protein subunit [Bacteroidales bacterium]
MDNNKESGNELKNRPLKTLMIHGEQYKTLYTNKFENRKTWAKPDARKIFSILPGTVLKVSHNAGDTVEKGELMMVLEAMKMQNTYYYPFSGKIKEMYVKPGDKVPKGFLMLEYE